MPTRQRIKPDSVSLELARCKVLCDILFGACASTAYRDLTGGKLGRFVMYLIELPEQGAPSLSEAVTALQRLPLGRCGAVFAVSPQRVVVLGGARRGAEEPGLEIPCGVAGAVGSATGSGAEDLPLCYRSCLQVLEEQKKQTSGTAVNALSWKFDKPVKPLLARAIEFIAANYTRPITLEDVARHAYVTPCHISRMFVRQLGTRYSEYLCQLRIREAERLLKDTNTPIGSVSDLVGISDAHYFAKLFRKQTGLSPSEFRRKG